jgi:hypothetical protein
MGGAGGGGGGAGAAACRGGSGVGSGVGEGCGASGVGSSRGIVTSMTSGVVSTRLRGEIMNRAAATAACSAVVIATATGDMWSERAYERLTAWATVTPFYVPAAGAAS